VALLTVLLVAAVATPSVLLDVGRARARACVASITEPRGPELPDCERLDSWLALPARVPWTRVPARILREELTARMAVARYVDAAVGTPDRERLAERRADVLRAADLVSAGTRLLRLSELGTSMPAPDLAELAFAMGDAEGLDLHAFDINQWYGSVHAIEVALLRGDFARARRLAEHYAGRPDHDLRLLVGALLCAGDDPHRGLDEVLDVERARAEKRTANFWRNFGRARVLVEACAARADVAAPTLPVYGGAGEWDHRDRLLVMRARLAQRRAPCLPDDESCPSTGGFAEPVASIVDRLESGARLDYRAELVGAIAAHVTDGGVLAGLARPRPDEFDPAARVPLTIVRMVDGEPRDLPFLSSEELATAADAILARAEQDSSGLLRATAGLLRARAATAAAAQGDRSRALGLARAARPLLFDDPATGELFESSVAYVAGDPRTAREAAARAVGLAPEARPVRAAALLQLAEIDAAAGQRLTALERAHRALAVADEARHPALGERARWTVTALEELERRAACGSAPAACASERQGESPARRSDAEIAAEQTVLKALGGRGTGLGDDVRAAMLERAMATWRRWLRDDAEQRRAHRYAALGIRGDAPDARAPYWVLGGLLVDEPAQVEPWLDAFSAIDASRATLRAHAWARLEAARWRGDLEAAELWLERYRSLERLANDPLRAEMLRQTRL
jgi:hypothetical protein